MIDPPRDVLDGKLPPTTGEVEAKDRQEIPKYPLRQMTLYRPAVARQKTTILLILSLPTNRAVSIDYRTTNNNLLASHLLDLKED